MTTGATSDRVHYQTEPPTTDRSSKQTWFSDGRAFIDEFLAFAHGRVRSAVALMLAGAMLEGIGLILLVPIAGLLVKSNGKARLAIAKIFDALGVRTQLGQMALLLSVFILTMILRAVVLTVRDRQLAVLQLGFVEQQRDSLMRALAHARWSDIAGLRHARFTNAIGTEVQMIVGAAELMLQSVVTLVMLTAQWLLTLLIAPGLALLVLLLGAIGVVVNIRTLRRASHAGTEQMTRRVEIMNVSGQLLAGLKLAKAQNAESAFVRDFEDHARALTVIQLDYQRSQSRIRIGTASASAIGGALVLMAGISLSLPLERLLAAIVILARMSGPAMAMQQNVQQIASMLPAHAAVARLRENFVRSAPPMVPLPAASALPRLGCVAFHDVSYRHSDGGGVSGVSVTIEPGEVIGIAGPSGAGKTTFIDLLTGLLEPSSGTIAIDGKPLEPGQAAQLRQRIAYVAQDTYLLNDTIRRNLSWGGPSVSDDAIWHALERTGAATLVRGMADGLETVIAERGWRLSGGERQRIALARALLRAPDLLILDEATNAIDIASERTIIADLIAKSPRPTIVVVAHRAETLQACERVLTFGNGRIVKDV